VLQRNVQYSGNDEQGTRLQNTLRDFLMRCWGGVQKSNHEILLSGMHGLMPIVSPDGVRMLDGPHDESGDATELGSSDDADCRALVTHVVQGTLRQGVVTEKQTTAVMSLLSSLSSRVKDLQWLLSMLFVHRFFMSLEQHKPAGEIKTISDYRTWQLSSPGQECETAEVKLWQGLLNADEMKKLGLDPGRWKHVSDKAKQSRNANVANAPDSKNIRPRVRLASFLCSLMLDSLWPWVREVYTTAGARARCAVFGAVLDSAIFECSSAVFLFLYDFLLM